MKVFISWSGSRSKKVAQIFRDWFPSVIQSIEPFVSSEDIEKGSRWNTDVAQELKESSFGIICVTKENLTAPWLNFEAGALSKTIDNSYVAPFLFDIKPSELKGSPISQFQATSFSKDDLKRLLSTLNIAASNCLPEQRLLTAFDVWYPSLEDGLNALRSEPIDDSEAALTAGNPDIFEELLEISRNTQRLLGNTDVKLLNNLEQLQKKVEDLAIKNNRSFDPDMRRSSRKYRPELIEELSFILSKNHEFDMISPYNLLVVLSIYREDFPWIYDVGSDLVKVIQSNAPYKSKLAAAEKFKHVLEFTCGHPMIREMPRANMESRILFRELPMLLTQWLESYLEPK